MYVKKQCPVCNKDFVVLEKAVSNAQCCTPGCLERMEKRAWIVAEIGDSPTPAKINLS